MKKLIITLITFASSLSLMAQQPDDGKRAEKIQALKIAFISQKLNLTSEEAQKFWPVYNNYETELRKVLKSDAGDALDNDERLLNLRKQFKPEFTKILGQPRVNKLFGAEREFRGVLIRQLKNKGNQQQRPEMRRGNK